MWLSAKKTFRTFETHTVQFVTRATYVAPFDIRGVCGQSPVYIEHARQHTSWRKFPGPNKSKIRGARATIKGGVGKVSSTYFRTDTSLGVRAFPLRQENQLGTSSRRRMVSLGACYTRDHEGSLHSNCGATVFLVQELVRTNYETYEVREVET